MKRRILALLLPLALALSLGAQAAVNDTPYADTPGASRIPAAERSALLPRSRGYAGQFADVSAGTWYYPYVAASYEYGLLEGRGSGFAPNENITVAELLTLSARIHAAYEGGTIPAVDAQIWYAPYVAYLRDRGLLDVSLRAYDAPATRAQLAAVFALSLPERCFDGQNATLVTDAYASGDYITDVDEYTPYQPQILWLYRQGLLSGMDAAGSYWPSKTTSRAEVAAVVTRMVDPSLRIALDWEIVPEWSVAGTTLADLIEAPTRAERAPAYDDAAAIDAAVRKMLASGEHVMELRYPYVLVQSEAQAIADAAINCAKRYCEQMYNSVRCQPYLNSGRATLTFGATACADGALERYREETMARAIEVHDMLWETGQLNSDMSQYEIARVYFVWLCDNCSYDFRAANDDYSLSHIAYSALIRGRAVCDGYTGAYNLFLKLEGIDCFALANNTHIWTVATLDGVEYHIDTTWGDQTGQVAIKYFGMSEAESYKEHPW